MELIDLALQAKQAHWNVIGPSFRSLHHELDQMADTCRRMADGVAERMAAIGVWPDGQVGEVARNTVVPPLPAGPIEDAAEQSWMLHAQRCRANGARIVADPAQTT